MYVDSHRHFIINTSSEDELIAEMNADKIEKTVLFGFNGEKFTDREHEQDENIIKIYKKYSDRILPFLCDFNFDDDAAEYITKELKKGLFKGIGEILIGHTEFKRKYFKNTRYNDDNIIKFFNIISEFKLPILVHVDRVFIDDFIEVLKKCSKGKFIWAHADYDFCNPNSDDVLRPDFIEKLLNEFENLNFDITTWKFSPLCFTDERWITIFEKYSDRFMFGTDMTVNYSIESEWVKQYEKIFDLLIAETMRGISGNNILRLCNEEILIVKI